MLFARHMRWTKEPSVSATPDEIELLCEEAFECLGAIHEGKAASSEPLRTTEIHVRAKFCLGLNQEKTPSSSILKKGGKPTKPSLFEGPDPAGAVNPNPRPATDSSVPVSEGPLTVLIFVQVAMRADQLARCLEYFRAACNAILMCGETAHCRSRICCVPGSEPGRWVESSRDHSKAPGALASWSKPGPRDGSLPFPGNGKPRFWSSSSRVSVQPGQRRRNSTSSWPAQGGEQNAHADICSA